MAAQKQWAHRFAAVALAAIVAFGALLAAKPTTAKADWVKYNGAYYYQYDNGVWAKNNWIEYNGAWYYIGSDYKVAVNKFVEYDDAWYYLGKDGKVVTGWFTYKGVWYYAYDYGPVAIDDFAYYGDAIYYMGSNGRAVTSSWIEYWGSYFYAGKDGKLVTNKFFQYQDSWYYLNENGWLVCDFSILYKGMIYTFGPDCKIIAVEPAGEAVTVEPQVIVDLNHFDVTVTDLMGYMVGEGPELHMTVNNEYDQALDIYFEDISVNGWQLNYTSGSNADPGVSEVTLTLDMKELKARGITQIAEIEFTVRLHDPETGELLYTQDPTTIKTSIADSYVQTYDDSGVEILNYGGLRFVVQGLFEDDFGSKGYVMYVYNESGYDISAYVEDATVNGVSLEGFVTGACTSGKHTFWYVKFFSWDLEEQGITDIHQIAARFFVCDLHTGQQLGKTGIITVDF